MTGKAAILQTRTPTSSVKGIIIGSLGIRCRLRLVSQRWVLPTSGVGGSPYRYADSFGLVKKLDPSSTRLKNISVENKKGNKERERRHK